MTDIALSVIGVALLYVCWSVLLNSWSRLIELGIEHKKSSTTYFDNILLSGLFGVIFGRILWMLTHMSLYQDVPFGLLPYSRSATEIVWFTVFPWRFFRLTEGVLSTAVWPLMGLLIIYTLFMPTIKLARKLKLEKRGVMRSFIVRSTLSAILVAIYFATLTYFSL